MMKVYDRVNRYWCALCTVVVRHAMNGITVIVLM